MTTSPKIGLNTDSIRLTRAAVCLATAMRAPSVTVLPVSAESRRANDFNTRAAATGPDWSAGVSVSSISENQAAGRRVLDPKNPSADADGYVTYSNVNAIEEMVNMISASRSYQNNVEVMNTAKSLLLKTLQMGN